MPSLYCARCGLHVQLRAELLWMENCPRCEARSKTVTPLVMSPQVNWAAVRPADGEPRLPPTRRRSRQEVTPAAL